MGNHATISVCVIDDDPIHAGALQAMAEDMDSMHLALCESVEDAALLDFPLGLILVNMEHGRKCSNQILVKILDQFPEIPVMCYSSGERWIGRWAFKRYGNRLIVMTYGELLRGLREYVESVLNGDPVFPRQPSAGIAGHEKGLVETIRKLSPREREVLCLLGKGHDVFEISDLLECRQDTVKSHYKSIRRKLKLCGIVELRRLAFQYARAGYCKVFSLYENHICLCRKESVGTCPLMERPF